MFTMTYDVQPLGSSLFYTIAMRATKLDENDRVVGFNVQEHLTDWLNSDASRSYKASPDAIALGAWLSLTEACRAIKGDTRGLLVLYVEIKAPTFKVRFGLTNNKSETNN